MIGSLTAPTPRRLAAALLVGALAFTACGSDGSDGDDGDDRPVASDPGETLPPATDPPATDAPAVELPFEPPADGSILEIGYYGGFTTRELAFQSPPWLLITADSRAIRPAAVPEIFPGPLLPQHTIADLTPEGLRIVMEEIESSGLLADVEYPTDTLVADAASATVIVRTADDTFVHEAYALDLAPIGGGDETPERAALAAAIERLTDLESLVGDQLGPEEPWQPDAYQLLAEPVTDLSGFELDPRIVPWPADSGVVLADATECTEVDREAIGSTLDDADQLTFFTQDGETYQVIARPSYPGRSC